MNQDAIIGLKKIPDNSIDLIITDPPYKVTSRGKGLGGGMLNTKIYNQGNVFKHNNLKPKDYIPEFYRVLKEGTHCYIMTNHLNLIEILNVATECGFHFTKSLVWDKGNKIVGTYYMSQFEYILFFRKGKGKNINHCGTSDILSIPNKKTKNEEGKNIHSTEKPVALMEILVRNSSDENDLVLDPFFGVGATALACLETNRKFIGFEIDEEYFRIAKKRLTEC